MARIQKKGQVTGKKILLVDDQPEYLSATQSLLEREGHEVVTALNGRDALAKLKTEPFDLVLLDYFMPGGMSGEEVVLELRSFDPTIQVILQTGYAGEYPPREMLKRLQIQGYHDKSDGPEKLLLWVDVGLKAAQMNFSINKGRKGLRCILDMTPNLHKIQSVEELLHGILVQITGLLGVVNSFFAFIPDENSVTQRMQTKEGFVAVIGDESNLEIRVATGKYAIGPNPEIVLESGLQKDIQEVLISKEMCVRKNQTLIPLVFGNNSIGLIYFDQEVCEKEDFELLAIFANQAAVAIQNAKLYEMATIDTLSGAYVRRFFDHWFLNELRSCFRLNTTLALFMIDLDKLKTLNDTRGHLCGDRAIAAIGKILLSSTRTSDIVGRYGGDEFCIVLPQADYSGAVLVAERILCAIRDKKILFLEEEIPLRASIGVAIMDPHSFAVEDIPHPVYQEYFQNNAKKLIQAADKMLYKIKKQGGDHYMIADSVQWLSLTM